MSQRPQAPVIRAPRSQDGGGDAGWAAFCAEVERLPARAPSSRVSRPAAPARAPFAGTGSGIGVPRSVPRGMPRAEDEDFSALLRQWETGSWTAPTPSFATGISTPGTVATRVMTPPGTTPHNTISHGAACPAIAVANTALEMPLSGGRWLGVDGNTARRLARGQLAPDAVLDLHGQTLPQAFESLVRWVGIGQQRGWRLLLVITGKGRPRRAAPFSPTAHRRDGGLPAEASTASAEGEGKLRRALPHWLHDPRLAPHLATAGPAHARHGGGGAFYLLLRRRAPLAGH